MDSDSDQPNSNPLAAEITALRHEVSAVSKRLSLPLPRMLGRQFLRGIAFGLGSVLGATIVVSGLIYILASIDFIPIIGEWAREIADMIRQP
jgi:uncharacterized protein DUF5665